MGTVSAKDLTASLDKAKNMGLVEEGFDLCGHHMVVRNLRPTEVEAVLEACKGLEDLPYVNAYQREHVSRAIVELDGFDLRETDFIDDEEPDPKKSGTMKRVRIERHKWLADKLVFSWGQEVIFTIYRKIGDCSIKADKEAKLGVVFLTPDETAEDKYRRLLGDLKEIEDDVPATLLDKTLDEFGLMRKSTAAELEAAQEKLSTLKQEEDAKAREEAPPEEEPLPPISPVAQAMANRKPLNQPEEAAPPERVVPQERPKPFVQAPAVTSARTAQLAALEGDADVVGVLTDQMLGAQPKLPVKPQEVAELGGSRPIIDPARAAQAVASIIDQPPPAGINPRFRSPSG